MSLEIEMRAYEAMRGKLETQHAGKYVMFYGDDFIGPYDTLNAASEGALSWHGSGPYLIRRLGVDELQDLVGQITPENRHEETDWGKPKGKEVW